MAKKDNKKAPKPEKVKGKKNKNAAAAMPVAGTPSTPGMYPPSMSTPGGLPSVPGVGLPSVPGGAPSGLPSLPSANPSLPSVPLANMPPEQMSPAQIEQALKECNDPESHLKKIRSPINVRSCLLNILVLIVLTLGIVLLWSYLAVDKFNFVDVVTDMSKQFGITDFFKNLWTQISGWFS